MMSRFFENSMASTPSEKAGVVVDLKGHAISFGNPCLVSVCHSGLSGTPLYPTLVRGESKGVKDSRRVSFAGMTPWRRLQNIEFFYGKPCLGYQFAGQVETEFVMLWDRKSKWMPD